jgi:uncharacterized protein
MAIDQDWRNRTADCEVWKGLFAHFESELTRHETPLSADPRRHDVERTLMALWADGRTSSVSAVLRAISSSEPA